MMRITWVATALLLGCMSSEPSRSGQYPILEGDWVLAPSLSAVPVSGATIPEGVVSVPVDLLIVSDDLVVACDENGTPMGGYDPTDDEDDGLGNGANTNQAYNPALGFEDDSEQAGSVPDVDESLMGDDGDPNEGVIDTANFEQWRELAGGAWLHVDCL